MRISEETLENFSISYPLERLAPLERILFIDIETTGFTARSSYLYLIGSVPAYRRSGKGDRCQGGQSAYRTENCGERGFCFGACLCICVRYGQDDRTEARSDGRHGHEHRCGE